MIVRMGPLAEDFGQVVPLLLHFQLSLRLDKCRGQERAGRSDPSRWAAKALSSDGQPKLEIIVALHVGTAFYGNIGAADRLDFTVIGPAVNLVSRIEAVGKALNIPIIVSDDFARSYGKSLHPLGRYVLRGTSYTPRTICTGFATVRSLLTRKSRIGQL